MEDRPRTTYRGDLLVHQDDAHLSKRLSRAFLLRLRLLSRPRALETMLKDAARSTDIFVHKPNMIQSACIRPLRWSSLLFDLLSHGPRAIWQLRSSVSRRSPLVFHLEAYREAHFGLTCTSILNNSNRFCLLKLGIPTNRPRHRGKRAPNPRRRRPSWPAAAA